MCLAHFLLVARLGRMPLQSCRHYWTFDPSPFWERCKTQMVRFRMERRNQFAWGEDDRIWIEIQFSRVPSQKITRWACRQIVPCRYGVCGQFGGRSNDLPGNDRDALILSLSSPQGMAMSNLSSWDLLRKGLEGDFQSSFHSTVHQLALQSTYHLGEGNPIRIGRPAWGFSN